MRPETGPNQAEPRRTVKVFCPRVKYRVLGGGAKVKRRTDAISHVLLFLALHLPTCFIDHHGPLPPHTVASICPLACLCSDPPIRIQVP